MSEIPLGLISLVLATPFLFLTIWLFYVIHMYTERAEALLPNSSFVEANKSIYSHMGFLGKGIRSGVITWVLLAPNLAVKRSLVNVADVKNFPVGLKWMLFMAWGLSSVFLVALVVLNVFRESLN